MQPATTWRKGDTRSLILTSGASTETIVASPTKESFHDYFNRLHRLSGLEYEAGESLL
jgi:hypothetical protein